MTVKIHLCKATWAKTESAYIFSKDALKIRNELMQVTQTQGT